MVKCVTTGCRPTFTCSIIVAYHHKLCSFGLHEDRPASDLHPHFGLTLTLTLVCFQGALSKLKRTGWECILEMPLILERPLIYRHRNKWQSITSLHLNNNVTGRMHCALAMDCALHVMFYALGLPQCLPSPVFQPETGWWMQSGGDNDG